MIVGQPPSADVWPVRHDPPPCSAALPTHLFASSQTSASSAFGPTSSSELRYSHYDINFASSNGSLGSHAGSQVIASSSPPSAASCPDPPGQPCSPALRPCSDGIATSSDANGPPIAGAHLGAVARLTWSSGP